MLLCTIYGVMMMMMLMILISVFIVVIVIVVVIVFLCMVVVDRITMYFFYFFCDVHMTIGFNESITPTRTTSDCCTQQQQKQQQDSISTMKSKTTNIATTTTTSTTQSKLPHNDDDDDDDNKENKNENDNRFHFMRVVVEFHTTILETIIIRILRPPRLFFSALFLFIRRSIVILPGCCCYCYCFRDTKTKTKIKTITSCMIQYDDPFVFETIINQAFQRFCCCCLNTLFLLSTTTMTITTDKNKNNNDNSSSNTEWMNSNSSYLSNCQQHEQDRYDYYHDEDCTTTTKVDHNSNEKNNNSNKNNANDTVLLTKTTRMLDVDVVLRPLTQQVGGHSKKMEPSFLQLQIMKTKTTTTPTTTPVQQKQQYKYKYNENQNHQQQEKQQQQQQCCTTTSCSCESLQQRHFEKKKEQQQQQQEEQRVTTTTKNSTITNSQCDCYVHRNQEKEREEDDLSSSIYILKPLRMIKENKKLTSLQQQQQSAIMGTNFFFVQKDIIKKQQQHHHQSFIVPLSMRKTQMDQRTIREIALYEIIQSLHDKNNINNNDTNNNNDNNKKKEEDLYNLYVSNLLGCCYGCCNWQGKKDPKNEVGNITSMLLSSLSSPVLLNNTTTTSKNNSNSNSNNNNIMKCSTTKKSKSTTRNVGDNNKKQKQVRESFQSSYTTTTGSTTTTKMMMMRMKLGICNFLSCLFHSWILQRIIHPMIRFFTFSRIMEQRRWFLYQYLIGRKRSCFCSRKEEKNHHNTTTTTTTTATTMRNNKYISDHSFMMMMIIILSRFCSFLCDWLLLLFTRFVCMIVLDVLYISFHGIQSFFVNPRQKNNQHHHHNNNKKKKNILDDSNNKGIKEGETKSFTFKLLSFLFGFHSFFWKKEFWIILRHYPYLFVSCHHPCDDDDDDDDYYSNDCNNNNHNNNNNTNMIQKQFMMNEIQCLLKLHPFIPRYYGITNLNTLNVMMKKEKERRIDSTVQCHDDVDTDHDNKLKNDHIHNKVTNQVRPHDDNNNTMMLGDELSTHYIVLQDITALYEQPCIIDIKMGTSTYEPSAPHSKQQQEIQKYHPQQTIFGFRIVGMRIYDPNNNNNNNTIHRTDKSSKNDIRTSSSSSSSSSSSRTGCHHYHDGDGRHDRKNEKSRDDDDNDDERNYVVLDKQFGRNLKTYPELVNAFQKYLRVRDSFPSSTRNKENKHSHDSTGNQDEMIGLSEGTITGSEKEQQDPMALNDNKSYNHDDDHHHQDHSTNTTLDYDEEHEGKNQYHGRTISDRNFMATTIQQILDQLYQLLYFFEKENRSFKFYASSLLIVYEGKVPGHSDPKVLLPPPPPVVKMIDFSHVRREFCNTLDEGYIKGLKTLIHIFTDIQKKY